METTGIIEVMLGLYGEQWKRTRKLQGLSGSYWAYMGNSGKEKGSYRDYRSYIGVIEGIMEKNMETTGIIGAILGLHRE